MLTKQQAAERLGVSVRAIENYSTKGKLTPHYSAGKRGKVALFDESEINRLKDERGEIVYTPKNNTALATIPPPQLAALFNALKGIQPTPAPASVATVGEKILLDLKDCHALTGLSDGHLREAIHARKLKGKIIGRGWKVKRADLDFYVKRL
jgi:excisionase family DNA binding protein